MRSVFSLLLFLFHILFSSSKANNSQIDLLNQNLLLGPRLTFLMVCAHHIRSVPQAFNMKCVHNPDAPDFLPRSIFPLTASYPTRNLAYLWSSIFALSSTLIDTVFFGLIIPLSTVSTPFSSSKLLLSYIRASSLLANINMASKLWSHLSFLYPLKFIHYLFIVKFNFLLL